MAFFCWNVLLVCFVRKAPSCGMGRESFVCVCVWSFSYSSRDRRVCCVLLSGNVSPILRRQSVGGKRLMASLNMVGFAKSFLSEVPRVIRSCSLLHLSDNARRAASAVSSDSGP